MPGSRALFRRAVLTHRQALGLLDSVRDVLHDMHAGPTDPTDSTKEQLAVAKQMRRLVSEIAPNWLGESWEELDARRPPVERDASFDRISPVRVAEAEPQPDATFPVLVPFVGVGHIAIDRDARDPAVAGLLRSLLCRLLISYPAGKVRLLAIDGGALGAPLAPFRPLIQVGLMNEPAVDLTGFRTVLEEAEEQVRRVQAGVEGNPDALIIVCAGLPPGLRRADLARLAAFAHAGISARVHLLIAGYPPRSSEDSYDEGPAPVLESTTMITSISMGRAPRFHVGDPAGDRFSVDGGGLNAPVVLDPPPPEGLLAEVCRHLVQRMRHEGVQQVAGLIPGELWQESSVHDLRTVVGQIGGLPAELAFNDATPHWLVGGRTGAGKTVFLLDVIYGLAARYSPDELAMYMLDFKEGVSFTEFVPTEVDPTWIPHARTVGVETDREYGVAVLAELVQEMTRRATVMKQSGVSKISELRTVRPDVAMPRIVTVIDEFHVLFQGDDRTAARAVALLDEVSRKARAYGIHLVLASQDISGIAALRSHGGVFAQFNMRIALSGGGSVLEPDNHASDALPIGQVILNDAAGARTANQHARFPDADPSALAQLRREIWERRWPGSAPPGLFSGHAEYGIADDPTYVRMSPRRAGKRPMAYLGRAVEVGLPAVGMTMDDAPGCHVAVLGTSAIGADILHAATLSLARQHEPGDANFMIVGLVDSVDDVVDDTADALTAAGHEATVLGLSGYQDELERLAKPGVLPPGRGGHPTYLVVFGADVASPMLREKSGSGRTGLDDLRRVLRDGPSRGVHLLGWWRAVRRFSDDLGTEGREDVTGVVALNVRGADLQGLVGLHNVEWTARPNRALFVDRHEDVSRLVVPFVKAGRYSEASRR